MKRAFLVVAGFFSLCLSLPAQSPDLLLDSGPLDRSLRPLSLSLENRDRFFFSTTFGTMHATSNFLPTFNPSERRSVDSPARLDSKDSFDHVVEMRPPSLIHMGGEVGFLYGKSSGKYGREVFETYIIGTVGNDKFSITAGYLHQEISGRGPGWRR